MAKVILREPTERDAEQLAALLREDAVLRQELGLLPDDLPTASDFLRKLAEWGEPRRATTFSIVVSETAVGTISLSHRSTDGRSARVGYWIGSAYRHRGYASQGFAAICGRARAEGIHSLSAQVATENLGSRRVWEKAGATASDPVDGKIRYELHLGAFPFLEDRGILFSWNGIPCGCRCDHCLLSSDSHPTTVSYQEAKSLVERFLAWRNASGKAGLSVDFATGFSIEFPQLLDYIAFRVQNGMQGADALQVGGIRVRSGAELRSFLGSLAQAGIRRLGLSFHGMDSSHDRCTGRIGDYRFTMELARAAAECGLKRFETIFLRRSTLGELPGLLARLDTIPGMESRHVAPLDYRGKAKRLEADRPTVSDLDRLQDPALRNMNRASVRAESDWVREIELRGGPARTRRYYLVPITDDTALPLRTTDPESLLAQMRDADRRLANCVPPLQELARRYADPDGERLYALRDLEWKWTDAFLAEHPDVDRTGAFDDQKPCILCK